MLAKQRYYRVLEKILHPDKSFFAINHRYFPSKIHKPVTPVPVPETWIKPYEERGIDMKKCTEEEVYWYDSEVLKLFVEHGANFFRYLDIWDTDWEKKRQWALAHGEIAPEMTLYDPRTFFQKMYHCRLQIYLEYAIDRYRQIKNFLRK
jgi:hypothetical protein